METKYDGKASILYTRNVSRQQLIFPALCASSVEFNYRVEVVSRQDLALDGPPKRATFIFVTP